MRTWTWMALCAGLLSLRCDDKGDKSDGGDADTDTDSDTDTDTDTDTDASPCPSDLADNTACVSLPDGMLDIPIGSAGIGAGSGAGLLRLAFSQNGYGGEPALNIDYVLETAPGTLDCTGVTTIAVTDANGDWQQAHESLEYYGTSCSLVLDATGPELGDPVEGHFTADLYRLSDGELVHATGTFRTSVLF